MAKRSKLHYEKYQSGAQAKHEECHKEGLSYKPGLTLAKATQIAKKSAVIRKVNSTGTPQSLMKCKYHHIDFCTSLGYNSTRNKEYFTNKLTAAERDGMFEKL